LDRFEQLSDLNDKVYIQKGSEEGINSIHFDKIEGPYISFENNPINTFLGNG